MTDNLTGGTADGAEQTFVQRVIGGDWRSAAFVAGPSILVAFALGLLASTYLLWFDTGGADAFGLGHSSGGFFHVAIGNLAMAFGSPLFTSGTGADSGSSGSIGAGIAPLTVSVLVLGVFALLLRTYL